MKDQKEKFDVLLHKLIDDRIDLFGEEVTVLFLLDNNVSVAEIIKLGFDEEDVLKIVANDTM